MVVQHPRLSTREQVRWKHGLRKLAQFARVLTPQLQFAKAGFTLTSMSLDFAEVILLKGASSGQRQFRSNGFMRVHCRCSLPRRLSIARSNRLFTVDSGMPATSAICSNFMSSSKRSVSTSR